MHHRVQLGPPDLQDRMEEKDFPEIQWVKWLLLSEERIIIVQYFYFIRENRVQMVHLERKVKRVTQAEPENL